MKIKKISTKNTGSELESKELQKTTPRFDNAFSRQIKENASFEEIFNEIEAIATTNPKKALLQLTELKENQLPDFWDSVADDMINNLTSSKIRSDD